MAAPRERSAPSSENQGEADEVHIADAERRPVRHIPARQNEPGGPRHGDGEAESGGRSHGHMDRELKALNVGTSRVPPPIPIIARRCR